MDKKIQLPLFEDSTKLPTGKWHTSFSEFTIWESCSWKHKLLYIDNLPGDPGNEHTAFGHAVHGILEDFLLKKDSNDFFLEDRIEQGQKEFLDKLEEFKKPKKEFADWISSMKEICEEMPEWLNSTFPGWETIAAEFPLFESIEKQTNKFFKGYIDCVIKVPKKPRKGSKPDPLKPQEYEFYIIDFKTCSWGWSLPQKTDKIKRMQLALYKNYFCKKFGHDPKTVKCGFVLLKRTAKAGNKCELVTVSVGEKTTEDSLQLVNRMLNSVSKRIFTKNRNSCKYCKFYGTKECP